jgi:hypothetical protein
MKSFKILTASLMLSSLTAYATNSNARKTASTVEEFTFPEKIEEYHCRLILAAEQPVGILNVMNEYEKFDEIGLNREDVLAILKTKAANAKNKSLYLRWDERTYCHTKVFTPAK